MFDGFNFEVLNDPEFKEDAVREELILPIIKALGYEVAGSSRIVRSKVLVHPYVAIGSQRKKVSIIPDYVFYSKEKVRWILDAKSPTEDITKSKHVEQAYSYAIHPEIRAELYALCNGKEFALYDIKKFEPILHFGLKEISKHWDVLFRILNPDIEANPALVEYQPDYGVFVRKIGAIDGFKFIALDVHASFIAKVADNQYTTMTVVPGDTDCLASLYFDEQQYQKLLSFQRLHIQSTLLRGLQQMPYYVSLEADEMLFGVSATLSNEVIDNNEESYIPFVVDEFFEQRAQVQP